MMPFRIPGNYRCLNCPDQDPSKETLRLYIAWLKQELATAVTALKEKTKPDKTEETKS